MSWMLRLQERLLGISPWNADKNGFVRISTMRLIWPMTGWDGR